MKTIQEELGGHSQEEELEDLRKNLKATVMKINSEDPRLTAYALGELNQKEVKEFEKILVENPELKLEIERINDTIDSIKKEFYNLPKEELSDEQKESLLSRNKIINTSPTTFSKISRWTGISAAAACFIGMGIIGFDSLKNNTKQESLTDSADERSSEMPPQSLGKIDEQKTALKDTNIQRLSLESEAILENDSEAKENKNRSFNRSLAKKQSIAVPQPAASIAAGSINIDNGGLGAVEAKQKVESGLRYSSNASSAKRLGRSARQEKLNFEYSEEIQLGADDFIKKSGGFSLSLIHI